MYLAIRAGLSTNREKREKDGLEILEIFYDYFDYSISLQRKFRKSLTFVKVKDLCEMEFRR